MDDVIVAVYDYLPRVSALRLAGHLTGHGMRKFLGSAVGEQSSDREFKPQSVFKCDTYQIVVGTDNTNRWQEAAHITITFSNYA